MTFKQFQRRSYLTLPLVFFFILVLATGAGMVHLLIELAYFCASIVAFVMCWQDKRLACQHRWRTSENMLHLSELFCGWPGAMLAQALCHHKTAKLSYQLVFWLCIALNLTALILWCRS